MAVIKDIQKKAIEKFMKNFFPNIEVDLDNLKPIDPTFEQVCIPISDDVFVYCQFDDANLSKPLYWHDYRIEALDFNDYLDSADKVVSVAHDSLSDLKQCYPSNWKQVLVELAFKQDL